jgi:integrase
MAQGKQAKILTTKQEAAILRHLETTRYPERNRAMFMLSVKAGLRAKEIARLTWEMITDANGEVADEISLPNSASKGKGGGRTIPLNSKLKAALIALYSSRERNPVSHKPVICSERAGRMSAASITVWFHRLYNDLGLVGCSSHSGRRTFITSLDSHGGLST